MLPKTAFSDSACARPPKLYVLSNFNYTARAACGSTNLTVSFRSSHRLTRPPRSATRRPGLQRATLGKGVPIGSSRCSHSVRRVAGRHRRVACATKNGGVQTHSEITIKIRAGKTSRAFYATLGFLHRQFQISRDLHRRTVRNVNAQLFLRQRRGQIHSRRKGCDKGSDKGFHGTGLVRGCPMPRTSYTLFAHLVVHFVEFPPRSTK